MKACFIGHRKIKKTEKLILRLKETVETLINNGVTTFYFGSKSEFNSLSWEIVTELKEKYSYIKRVYVRSSYQYIERFYKEYLLDYYEDAYYPTKLEKSGKCCYVERNYEMIDNSNYCVFYYDKNYISIGQVEKLSLPLRHSSGTKIAYKYAEKKKKIIINMFE